MRVNCITFRIDFIELIRNKTIYGFEYKHPKVK